MIRLSDDLVITAITAAELECYAEIRGDVDRWWQPLHQHWQSEKLPVLRIEKERGEYQYEIILGLDSPAGTAGALQKITRDMAAHAHATMTRISFAAKPYPDQPASGLHLHVHLEDAHGVNLFTKNEENLSEPLAFSLGGLLACMPLALPFYCPFKEDALRFADADHVPRANAWGANNRYTALRIPTTQTMYDKHIELRVPSSSANPHDAMKAMLASIAVGLEQRIFPPAQEFGKPNAQFLEALKSQEIDAAVASAFSALMVSA